MATPKRDFLQGMDLDLFIVNHLDRLRRMRNIKANLQKRSRADYSIDYVKRQLEILEREWDEAQTRHARLLASVSLEERKNEEYFNSEFMDDFERIYHETNGYIYGQLRILEKMEQQEERAASNSSAYSSADNQASVRLPRLDLPHFSGNHPEWPSCSDLSAVINNRTLSDAQRLQYLKAALEGDALRTVSPLELTNENFSLAWGTLEQRYNIPRLIQSSWFEKVLNLKPIKHDNVGSITQVTVGLQQALNALPKLGVSVTDWGPLMVYYVSSQFDKELMLEWEQTFDDARRFPEFRQMMSFLQKKVSAILARPASSKYENRKVRSHATAVDTGAQESSLKCSLCMMQHRLSDCKEFMQRDTKRRYYWVKATYGCLRCLSADHTQNSCTSKERCDSCGEPHHTLLHFESKTQAASGGRNPRRRDTRR
ncbi:uncharacterized protein LOC108630077, partial [Ceratina calcarata]|uniref:Uncharacterized protein LOC108630077 n=1 Tax=Ceratina calcarata TaxID=156304 RepID=A0AAJ7JBI1_9HYME